VIFLTSCIYKYYVFPTENLDAMIALQTKNKLGKSLVPLSITPPTGKSSPKSEVCKSFTADSAQEHFGITLLFPNLVPGKAADDDDNTKTEAAKMQKEYESLKDSTKDIQAAAEISEYTGISFSPACLWFWVILKASQVLLV